MGKHGSRRNEIVIDDPQRFWVKQYMTTGYCLHFHRNLEIYGVVHGKVAVIIDGQQNILTDGQIAIVDCLKITAMRLKTPPKCSIFTSAPNI